LGEQEQQNGRYNSYKNRKGDTIATKTEREIQQLQKQIGRYNSYKNREGDTTATKIER
jgi:hypothetical protein